jgi:hypothetical protein
VKTAFELIVSVHSKQNGSLLFWHCLKSAVKLKWIRRCSSWCRRRFSRRNKWLYSFWFWINILLLLKRIIALSSVAHYNIASARGFVTKYLISDCSFEVKTDYSDNRMVRCSGNSAIRLPPEMALLWSPLALPLVCVANCCQLPSGAPCLTMHGSTEI